MEKRGWLLLETLGTEPVVVAQGTTLRNGVPIGTYLRRSHDRVAVTEAVRSTMENVEPVNVVSAATGTRIVTYPVVMSDGQVHGVQTWSGPPLTAPPLRPKIGAVVWDLSSQRAAATPQALINGGHKPTQPTSGRCFAEDMPVQQLNPCELEVISFAIRAIPGETICGTWDLTSFEGKLFSASFFSRLLDEGCSSAESRVVCRTMNWRLDRPAAPSTTKDLAHQIVTGLAEVGAYRAIVDLSNWNLLKWLDPPCPYFDWREQDGDRPLVHPDDRPVMARMADDFAQGPTSEILRLRCTEGTWQPIHTTISRIVLEPDVVVGLITMRLPPPHQRAPGSGPPT